MRLTTVLIPLGLAVLAMPAARACSSCGCTLSSDWVGQGIGNRKGYSLDLRYDYIDQTAFRAGSSSAPAPSLPDAGEVEHRTTNRYVTATLGYSPDRDWGFQLVVPYLDRSHSTFAPGDTDPSLSHTRSLSDIKLIGRYQGFSETGDTGLTVGVKLPTGSRDKRFNAGPEEGGDLDRSLQAGTGSTDLILGVFRYGSLGQGWNWFAQGTAQMPVKIKDEFRPGAQFLLNGGLRHEGGLVSPQVQVNVLERRPDGGANGDADNSGGRSVALSPGAGIALAKGLTAYGFVQIPVYQHVEGVQIAPRWSATAGISYTFR